jgi:hypothetical protein
VRLTSLATIDTSAWKPRGALWLKSKTGSTGKFTRCEAVAVHEKCRPCEAALFALSTIKPITAKARPRGENVIDLMEALRQSVGATEPAVKGKKMRKASAGQKEMMMPIEGKKPAKQAVKKTTKSQQIIRWCRGNPQSAAFSANEPSQPRDALATIDQIMEVVCTENFKPERSADEARPKGRVNL